MNAKTLNLSQARGLLVATSERAAGHKTDAARSMKNACEAFYELGQLRERIDDLEKAEVTSPPRDGSP